MPVPNRWLDTTHPIKQPLGVTQTRITFNVTYEDKDRWWNLAHENGMTLSEFIRVALENLEESYAEVH